jgi:bleomycin hydrolase
MHIIGLARNNKGKKFYIVKDSGGDYGPYGGLIYMSEAYLKMKTIAITLNKNSLPQNILERMNKD